MPYVPLSTFAPDADPTEEGILTECDLLTPTLNGFKALPGDVDAGLPDAPSDVASVYAYKLLDGTNRIVAGTSGSASAAVSMLYDVTLSSWTDRTRVAGAYTASAAARWVFANVGDNLYAAQKGSVIQKSTGGVFADTAGGAPQATIIVAVLDFLVAFNTDDTDGGNVYGDDPNRWWCSAAGDPDSWTADIATQATTGLLTDGPGAITAAGRVGSNLVAFKEQGAYLGQYIGAPVVWGWQRVPGEGLGAFSPLSVVDVEGTGLLFPGRDNFYIFDGNRATPIGTNRVAEFFYNDLDINNAKCMIGFHDRATWTVYWWYPDNGATLTRYLAYNYRSNKWAYGLKTVQAAFEYLEPGITYDGINDYYGGVTYDNFPSGTYDRFFASGGTFKPATVDASKTIVKLEGTGNNCSYTTGNQGVDGINTVLTRVRPRFKTAATTGTQAHLYADQLGGTETTSNASTTMTDGSFDHVYAGRWHKLKHSFTGSMEIMGLDVEAKPDSME